MSLRSHRSLLITICLALTLAFLSCGKKDEANQNQTEAQIIQNSGSDTMVNVAQAWAEEYKTVAPSVSVEVSGGGSGTGIAALINGTVDIANCSREMHADEISKVIEKLVSDAEKKTGRKMPPDELAKAKQDTTFKPWKFTVGFDALAVYMHKDNPLNEISLQQLADIYGEGGTINKWSQLGVTVPGCANDEIIRLSRQSNSGTYEYFREALLGKSRDFALGSRDMNGSKDVVDLVANTPCAIGYSGLGYHTPEVKMLNVSKAAGETSYAPSIETTLNKTYPIARPLFMYSLGEPTGAMQTYLDWIRSNAGQKVLADVGYVPLPDSLQTAGKE